MSGTARPCQNGDVLVEPGHDYRPTLLDMARLHDAIEALCGRAVDVTKQGLSWLLAQEILAHREILYAGDRDWVWVCSSRGTDLAPTGLRMDRNPTLQSDPESKFRHTAGSVFQRGLRGQPSHS